MKKLRVPYSSRVTLVIEHDEEIVWYSHAMQAMTHENMIYQLENRKKQPEAEPLGFEFEYPQTLRSISFTQPYPMDVILVDRFDNVFCTWTEPANPTKVRSYRTFTGLRTMVLGPAGFIREAGIIPGVSKLTLRSSMAWAAIHTHEVFGKELKAMTDQEQIEIYNGMVGTGYMGNLGSARRCAVGGEIQSRPFDHSEIFSPGSHGSIDFISFQKKVRLSENRLEPD